MSSKRFRIAVSFAGEKREYVARVAAILAERFGEEAILYDKYHQPEFSRSDLAFYLPDLYEKQADLVVAVFCPDYEQKEWCGLEWNAIFGLLKKRKTEEVMLARFNRVEGRGLHDLAGYVDLDDLFPEEAADLILERLALNEDRPKDHYKYRNRSSGERVRTSIPNNLPRLQPFFGREDELAAIREALDPESRTWGVLIDGPGGMGKTSLAVRAAYDCPPGSFQRIIFLSVKDRELDDDGERQLGGFILPGFIEMLNELARELGQPDIAKAPEDQRIRLLLDALRPAEALLILDNLESLTKSDRDQLFTFVKRLPQGCKAILTSRRRIGSGSELLILEKLSEAAALETLADLALRNKLLAKTSEPARLDLYRETSGKPLLLRWVAGQLGRGSCRTLSDALDFLRSCPPGNDPLEFVFGDLAMEFTEEETRVLAALTYFTLPARVKHVTDVAGLDMEPVETALHTLANRSLVVPDQEETTYTLVPLVADFLRRKRPDVVAATGTRMEEHAYALIIGNGYQLFDRFPVLDAAWPNIGPALPRFLYGPNDRLQTVCGAFSRFLHFTGRYDELLSLNQQAESRAVAAGDYLNSGWRAHQVGWVHFLRGQPDEVLACADRAAAHWQAARAGARERSVALRLRGAGHQLREDYPAAIAAYTEALGLVRTIAHTGSDVAILVSDLADVKLVSGDPEGAERDYREALQLARDAGDAEDIAVYTGKLATVALRQDDWAMAERLVREDLDLTENLGRQELIGAACLRLALVLMRRDEPVEALPHIRRAVDILTRLDSASLTTAMEMLSECESAIGTSN